jgi:hypothetical protein
MVQIAKHVALIERDDVSGDHRVAWGADHACKVTVVDRDEGQR